MGYGWTHNYNIILSLSDPSRTDHFRITDESGRYHLYKDTSGNNIHTGCMSTTGTLVREAGGTYTWHRANGTTYTFNQDLKFTSKTDGNGNVQSLSYNTEGLLETVTDHSTGRTIGFLYNEEDRIEHITGPITAAVPGGIWITYQYDAVGNLTRVIYADDDNGSGASGFEYQYSDPRDPHNLTEKRNLAGEFISSWKYDRYDRAYENISRDGKGVTISGYGTSSVTVTDAQGVQKTYTTETFKGRKTITHISGANGCASCGGDAVRYGYDDKRRVNEIEYANGRIDQYTDFDTQGRYQTEIQAVGTPQQRNLHYTYHPETGEKLSIIEASILGPGNKETIFDYDDDGNDIPNENPTRRLRRTIERGYTYSEAGTIAAYTHITSFTYNDKGQVLAVDGPLPGNQDRISYTYDPVTGDRLTETRPLAGTTHYTYDPAGNLETILEPDGTLTTIAHDGRNRQLSVTRNGITESRTYTAAGELDTTTDALGRNMHYAYNSAGFTEKITDPSGNFIFYGYDAHGRRTEQSIFGPDNTQTHFRATVWGDPRTNPALSSTKPWKSLHRNAADTADLETVYAYDSAGNLTSVTDAQNNTTEYRYDPFDRLIQVIQPGQTVTIYSYDAQGNLTSVTDAEGNFTRYDYDDLGRLVETDSPDTGATLYHYDPAGNLLAKVHNGKRSAYRYDALGRLTHILYDDAAENVTMTYDTGTGANLLGRLASVTDAAGSVAYSYDEDGRLESELRTIDDMVFETQYGYDDAGNLRTIIYPTGQSIEYLPDPSDPARIGAVMLNGTRTLAADLAYKPFGPMRAMSLEGGLQVLKTYDKNYQISTIRTGQIMHRAYNLDNVGNIKTITDHLDAPRTQHFDYDQLYRLTNAEGIYGTISYAYDKVGNRTQRIHDPDQHDQYTYYPGTNRLRAVTGTHAELFQYDADGNTTQRIPGAANTLPEITDPPEFTYNSSGQRTKKDAADTHYYHYDQSGQLIAETDTAGTLLKAYIWLHGQPLAMIDATGELYYYHIDHLGTPQAMTRANSTEVVWAADYLPFGHADVIVSAVESNLRFAGQYYDGETGLHYNWHRYYDPKIGRYLRADPIGLAGGLNVFVYAENNPIALIDPKGLDCGPGAVGDWYIPDFIFGECCSAHDRCYEGNSPYNCNTPKSECDSDACECFKRRCFEQRKETERRWQSGPKPSLPPDIEFDACMFSAVIYCKAISKSKKSKEQFDKARKVNGCCP
jgi:RHS repeat-associated protein